MIKASGITKSYENIQVLRDVSLTVHRGESVAIIGTNGAGKTTLVRSLLGLETLDCGTVEIAGATVDERPKISIGYLPEERGLFQKDKVLDVLRYFGELRGLTKSESLSQALEFLVLVGLEVKANHSIESLSNGQQQRVHLGITFMGSPDLLVLDEPTRGFDPSTKSLFEEMIKSKVDNGATLVLITHQMSEVSALADRIFLIANQGIAFSGTEQEMLKKYGADQSYKIVFMGDLPSNILDIPHVEILEENTVIVKSSSFGGVQSSDEILNILLRDGLKICEFSRVKQSLEEVFKGLHVSELVSSYE